MTLFEATIFGALGFTLALTVVFAAWAVRCRAQSTMKCVLGFMLKWLLLCIVLALFFWASAGLLSFVAGPGDIDPAAPVNILALLVLFGMLVGSVGFPVVAGIIAIFGPDRPVVRAR